MDNVQILSIAISGLLLLLVLELVRRRKLTEEYSFIWLACALLLFLLSIWREMLHVVARWMGIYYPPIVLLLTLIFFVFVALLYFSVVISAQREQIEHLVVEVALLTDRLRRSGEAKCRSSDPPGPPEAAGSDR